MKKLVFIIAAVCAGIAFSDETHVEGVAKKKGISEKVLKKTGGIAEKKGEGKIVIVNCQDLISDTLISERAERLGRLLKCSFEVVKGAWDISANKPSDANFAIYVINDAKLPMSLVAAESGWGVVNTVGLAEGDRFSKQLTRVFALTVGAMCSHNIHSPMQPVSNVRQLDSVKSDNIMRDMIDSIRMNMTARGMTASRVTSYRKACEEGWAPQPTNEYQKAIWKEVHTIPDKPLTIEYDPKKDK